MAVDATVASDAASASFPKCENEGTCSSGRTTPTVTSIHDHMHSPAVHGCPSNVRS